MLFFLYYTNVDLYVYSPVIVLINELINTRLSLHSKSIGTDMYSKTWKLHNVKGYEWKKDT